MYRAPTKYAKTSKNILYYNPWEFNTPPTPPFKPKKIQRLEQLALRRGLQLGFPIDQNLRDELQGEIAANRIQMSYQNYQRMSENEQCVNVMLECRTFTKNRIIQCILEFIEYIRVDNNSGRLYEDSFELYNSLYDNIVVLALQGKSEEEFDYLYNLFYSGNYTPQEKKEMITKLLAYRTKDELQYFIDENILKYIAPLLYYQ